MKLPFDLGVKFFFRLVLPGFLVTLGAWPVLFRALDALGWPSRHETGLVVATMIAGWLLVVLDMPIYMLYEGRRWWPAWLRRYFLEREKTRCDRLQEQVRDKSESRKYIEASVSLREFPLDANGRPVARFPTRLGNLITSFETYPDSRYGMDGVFYWPRLWLGLSKETREDLDSSQAVADSALYSSCALAIAALLWGAYGLAAAAGYPVTPRAGLLGCIGLAMLALIGSVLCYRAAIPVSAQFGELFKAVFDTYGGRPTALAKDLFDVRAVLKLVSDECGIPPDRFSTPRERFRAAWRYLHNYRIKCPECGLSVPAPECRAHVAAHNNRQSTAS